MANFEIAIKATGDILTALSAAVTVVKALNIEFTWVDCGDGINVLVSKDSRVSDLYKIYELEKKLKTKEVK